MAEICSYKTNLKVSVYDVDFLGRAKPSSILNYFQEAATAHSVELGVSYFDLIKVNEYWVLSRICVEIDRCPQYGEEIVIETYPIAPRGIDCDRDYYIKDLKGNVLVRGTSKWLILDLKTHKIKHINPGYFENCIFTDKRAINDPKWKVPDCDNPRVVYTGVVGVEDLDFNDHMNNAKYAQMLLNSLSEQELKNNDIIAFNVNYLSEMKYKDEYIVNKSYANPKHIIMNVSDKNDSPCFKGEIMLEARR